MSRVTLPIPQPAAVNLMRHCSAAKAGFAQCASARAPTVTVIQRFCCADLRLLSLRLDQMVKASFLSRRLLNHVAISHIGGVRPFLPIATNFAFGASGVITTNTFWPAASIARSVGSNLTIGVPTGTKTFDMPPL